MHLLHYLVPNPPQGQNNHQSLSQCSLYDRKLRSQEYYRRNLQCRYNHPHRYLGRQNQLRLSKYNQSHHYNNYLYLLFLHKPNLPYSWFCSRYLLDYHHSEIETQFVPLLRHELNNHLPIHRPKSITNRDLVAFQKRKY